ncbi:MAG TPA: bifunctional aspartate kinase/homoserine dehydrogenase I, partial [Balneolaceae bacterium]|nr:bifunctional aspartate kinase/homoserine dehydrogenase I [Balneolaceae bacterium]
HEITPRTLDFILGFGERLSAYLMSQCLCDQDLSAEYIDARELIKTDDTFGRARVLKEQTSDQIRTFFNGMNGLPVVTGFIGATKSGESTTLGRGGSDYTASLLAAALQAETIEIWTDVDGLLTADPRKVGRAFTIPSVSYEEAMELSHFGASVIYPSTLQPAKRANIPVLIRNTFAPDRPGTKIGAHVGRDEKMIKGISSIDDIAFLTVRGSGMVGVSGVAARIFDTLARENINIILITQASSEHTVCLAVLPEFAERAKTSIEEEFRLELQEENIDEVLLEHDLSVIAVVGDHMHRRPGIAGRVFNALGRNGINIVAIAQGSSERNISFVIRRKDESKALNTLHDAFFLGGVKTIHLFLVGVGLIGGTLLKLIRKQLQTLYENYLIDVNLIGLANSRKMLIRKDGLKLKGWKKILEEEGEKSDLSTFIQQMKKLNLPNSIFVDCTASDEVPQTYRRILSSSISVVTPNKKANSVAQKYYDELQQISLQHNAAYRYETNVGAGLPVVATTSELISTGDKIQKIEGVLSGTLSYIFNQFDGQTSFSEIVRLAREKGYTEPDPREDLNGHDVGRKLLILAREAGFELEFDDLEIQNLVPEEVRDAPDVETFFEQLKDYDDRFEQLRAKAEREDKKLCYIARFENGEGIIRLQKIAPDHPFYQLSGSDNIVAFTTNHYRENPMVIKGPGAGAEVTASGVIADILRVANTAAFTNAG